MKSMLMRPLAAWNAFVLIRHSEAFQRLVRETSDDMLDDLTDPYEETLAGMTFTIDWGNENIASVGDLTGNGIEFSEAVLTFSEPHAAYTTRMTPLWGKADAGRLRIKDVISFGDRFSAPDLRISTILHDHQQTHHFIAEADDTRFEEIMP